MAWDTEGTRRRLKEAATAEFAEHGPDGTTMARIAERAGINKERLYKYFGDKQALFETVLTDELDKLAASVAPVPRASRRSASSPGARSTTRRPIPSWSGCCCGRGWPAARWPTRPTAPPTTRTRSGPTRPPSGPGVLDGDLDPEHLVFMIIGLAAWWVAAPQLARMLTGRRRQRPGRARPPPRQRRPRRRAPGPPAPLTYGGPAPERRRYMSCDPEGQVQGLAAVEPRDRRSVS